MANSSEELNNLMPQSENSGCVNQRIQELSLQLAMEKREKSELEKLVAKQEGTIAKLHDEIRALYKESGRSEEKIGELGRRFSEAKNMLENKDSGEPPHKCARKNGERAAENDVLINETDVTPDKISIPGGRYILRCCVPNWYMDVTTEKDQYCSYIDDGVLLADSVNDTMPRLLTGTIELIYHKKAGADEMVSFLSPFISHCGRFLQPDEENGSLKFTLYTEHTSFLNQNAKYQLFMPPHIPETDENGDDIEVARGAYPAVIRSVSMRKFVSIQPNGYAFPNECDASEATVFALEPISHYIKTMRKAFPPGDYNIRLCARGNKKPCDGEDELYLGEWKHENVEQPAVAVDVQQNHEENEIVKQHEAGNQIEQRGVSGNEMEQRETSDEEDEVEENKDEDEGEGEGDEEEETEGKEDTSESEPENNISDDDDDDEIMRGIVPNDPSDNNISDYGDEDNDFDDDDASLLDSILRASARRRYSLRQRTSPRTVPVPKVSPPKPPTGPNVPLRFVKERKSLFKLKYNDNGTFVLTSRQWKKYRGNAQLKNPNGKILFNDPSTQIGLFGNGLSDTVVNFEFFDIDQSNGSVTLRTYNDEKKEIRYLGVNAKNFLHITSRGKCNAAKFKLERHVRRAA